MPNRSIVSVSTTARLRAAAFACAVVAGGIPMTATAAAPKARPQVYIPPSQAELEAAATRPAAGDKSATTVPAGPVVAEGTFISDRVGRFERDDKSPFPQLTLAPESASARPSSVSVVPNQMLAAMEQSAGAATAADFRVSGTMTLYRGRNLLVIDTASPSGGAPENTTATAPASAPAPAARGPATRPSTHAAAATAPASDKTASAEQLLGQMLKPPAKAGAAADSAGQPLRKPETPPETDANSGKGAVKPGAPAVTVLREGTYLVDRLGRLTRSADGSTAEFSFESDGAALQDPPVVIVPNLKLMAMEDAANAINRDLRFRITGQVTEYRGRNYVLLEKAVVVPDAMQQFRGTQQ